METVLAVNNKKKRSSPLVCSAVIKEDVVEKLTCMPGVARKLTRTADRTVMLLLSLSPEDFGFGVSYSDANGPLQSDESINQCTTKCIPFQAFQHLLTCSPEIVPR
jgi:hypothetical protein